MEKKKKNIWAIFQHFIKAVLHSSYDILFYEIFLLSKIPT